MHYDEATNFLFDLRRFQVDPGTASVRALLAELGDPHETPTVVQVAGSNGKGSVARMVASVLRETDRRVGLYTSPHFEDLRERIRVDGRPIPEAAVTEFVEEVRPWLVERAADGEPLTFFEVVTAMALWRFDRADVDVAVLEAGMGGELDATSVVEPDAAAVTNVALEHTSVLGETVPEIARSFAPVTPADAPLVTAASGEGLATLREAVDELVTVAGPGVESDVTRNADGDDSADTTPEPAGPTIRTSYEGRESHQESRIGLDAADWELSARLPLLGAYQATNAGVATALLRQLGVTDTGTIQRGLRNATWPGRFEVVETEPTVVLDGAHNPAACAALADTVAEFDHGDCHVVFGAMHDKDHGEMAAALPSAATVRTCTPGSSRAADPAALARVFERETDATVYRGDGGVDGRGDGHGTAADEGVGDESDDTAATGGDGGIGGEGVDDSVVAALAAARADAAPEDLVLLTGSLYCVAAARAEWTRTVTRRQVDDGADAREVLDGVHATPETVTRRAAETVHEVVETRLDGERARTLRDAANDADVTVAASGFDDPGRTVRVVLAGTHAGFRRLCGALRDRGLAFHGVADDLGDAVFGEGDRDGRTGRTERDRDDADDAAESYPWETGTAVMGVLNVTPDSFHDGGEYYDIEDAVAGARELVAAGVDVVDVGGESTRPGADPVPVDEEIERIVPVIEAVTDAEPDVLVSADTRKPAVAEAALDAGADVLNDVTGLADPEMRFLAAERDVPVIVMHSIDAPVVPDKEVEYDDVVRDVIAELRERVLLAEEAGVPRENVIVDPGLGFGKTAAESFELLGRVDEFHALGCPVLIGHSHKSMFEFVDGETGDALPETVAGTAVAAANGADLVRVHDARENVQAVRVAAAAADPDGFAERFHGGE
ncbi:dihydropteroate synthase [Halobaculum sp. MBLA0147]|uniref:dihydropteroate synthase n=1 Tax=Halobaculum sp. MBLA0147 TaxID=3079934 RepID=UPI0035265F3E